MLQICVNVDIQFCAVFHFQRTIVLQEFQVNQTSIVQHPITDVIRPSLSLWSCSFCCHTISSKELLIPIIITLLTDESTKDGCEAQEMKVNTKAISGVYCKQNTGKPKLQKICQMHSTLHAVKVMIIHSL